MAAAPPGRGLLARRRDRRRPLVILAGSVAQHPVRLAVPVHRRDPAVMTILGLVEILSFVALVLTAAPLALGLLVVSCACFLGWWLADRRAVLALGHDGEGTLLDADRAGRPTRVLGPAVLEGSLPAPTGLSARVRASGTTWWVDRASYRSLRPSEPPPR